MTEAIVGATKDVALDWNELFAFHNILESMIGGTVFGDLFQGFLVYILL